MLRSYYALGCLAAVFGTALLIGCGTKSSAKVDTGAETESYAPPPVSAPSSEFLAATDEPIQQIANGTPDEAAKANEGLGPGMGGDKYAHLPENEFVSVQAQPLSTFSIDVDTASYSKARMYLLQHRTLPPPDAIRIEELVNYFDYSYEPPTDDDPFAIHVEVARCPWKPSNVLARVALKGREIHQDRPASNLVFLIDVSGSMNSSNKLGLLKQSLQLLVEQLRDQDQVAIVVYAGAAGVVLPSTPGDQKAKILAAIDRLEAGGSTNGGAGIHAAYQVAKSNFVSEGVNRVILCTDGDFNVGATSPGDLVRMAETEAKAGVFLTVLGFGMGNHNDAMLEELSRKANGNYAFIDTYAEARKVFVDQIDGTLVTIAKDVKIQIEFNPAQAKAYRLIGYENRMLQAHEFNDDRRDAGEIGAGHTVTALYEVIPSTSEEPVNAPAVDDLKYQVKSELSENAHQGDLMTVKLRYKQPDGDTSRLITRAVPMLDQVFAKASDDFRFAASVAAFGMLLRRSAHVGDSTLASVLEIADTAVGEDRHGYRQEFLTLVAAAREIPGGEIAKGELSPGIPSHRVSSRGINQFQFDIPGIPVGWRIVGIGILGYVTFVGFGLIFLVVAIVQVASRREVVVVEPSVKK